MSDPEIVGVLDFSSARRPIVWVSIPKFHVEDLDYTYVVKAVDIVTRLGKRGRGSLIMSFAGYGDVPDEIYEIDEIRDYVAVMLEKFPHIFYMLNPFNGSARMLFLCLCDVVAVKSACTAKTTLKEWNKAGVPPWNRPKTRTMWSAPDDLVQTIIKEAGKYAIDVGDDDMLGFQRHFKALFGCSSD
jgi:hypothetical protein